MPRRNFNSLTAGWLLAILPALLASSASAQWGDLKVHFKVDGKAPQLAPLPVPAGAACPPKVANESFVVDKDGNIQNVVVFLVDNGSEVKVHPGYDKAAKDKIVVANKGCRFEPHVALLRVGQTLTITNADMFGHNSQYNFPENKVAQNPLIPPGGSHVVEPLTKSERRAQPVSCAIHPWMTGYVLVQNHPYMATSAGDGTLTIKDLPAGKHTFAFWQENVGYVPSNGKLTTSKGKAEIEIEDGKVKDLGTVLVKYKTK